MDGFPWADVLAIIGAALGGGGIGSLLIRAWLTRAAAADGAAGALVATLFKQIKHLETRLGQQSRQIADLITANLACEARHAATVRQTGELAGRLARLEAQTGVSPSAE